tara:strand:+ start:125 stop:394 length:270 start_codon:yes stop_codon:yes gene_type:complete
MAAVVIRLKRLGTKHKPHHRIVAIQKSRARGGRALEELGIYDPSKDPSLLKMNVERIQHWISKGAKPSPTVSKLFKRYTKDNAPVGQAA